MIKYLKRLIKFIINGQPKKEIKVTVGKINPTQLLQGKKILITGATRGIGYEIAKKCVSEGAEVVITGRNIKTLKEAQEQLGKACHVLEYDVTNFNIIDEKIEKAAQMLGGNIDFLINNAGISLHEENYLKVTLERLGSTV